MRCDASQDEARRSPIDPPSTIHLRDEHAVWADVHRVVKHPVCVLIRRAVVDVLHLARVDPALHHKNDLVPLEVAPAADIGLEVVAPIAIASMAVRLVSLLLWGAPASKGPVTHQDRGQAPTGSSAKEVVPPLHRNGADRAGMTTTVRCLAGPRVGLPQVCRAWT